MCSIQQCTEHIQPSTVISKNDSKKCVHFGTTARVIRVNSDIAEEKFEKWVEFLSSKLNFKEITVTKDIKTKPIFILVNLVNFIVTKIKIGEILSF